MIFPKSGSSNSTAKPDFCISCHVELAERVAESCIQPPHPFAVHRSTGHEEKLAGLSAETDDQAIVSHIENAFDHLNAAADGFGTS